MTVYLEPKTPLKQFDPGDVVFHKVIDLPRDYEVYDFTTGYDPDRKLRTVYGVGKYAEIRPGMYTSEQFLADKRIIHMGIDIAAPIGEPVCAFADGVVFKAGYNDLPLDYGGTIITKHFVNGFRIFALHGHLSKESLTLRKLGEKFQAGAILGRVGNKNENGGWNPHLHFQLSQVEPTSYDLPGVVSPNELEWAKTAFPDPQLVLGKLY